MRDPTTDKALAEALAGLRDVSRRRAERAQLRADAWFDTPAFERAGLPDVGSRLLREAAWQTWYADVLRDRPGALVTREAQMFDVVRVLDTGESGVVALVVGEA